MKKQVLIFDANKLTEPISTFANPSISFVKAHLISSLPSLEAIHKLEGAILHFETKTFDKEGRSMASESGMIVFYTDPTYKQPIINFQTNPVLKFEPDLFYPNNQNNPYVEWKTTFEIKGLEFLPNEKLHLEISY